jgi:Ca-activated chloride channel homolog
MIRFPSPLPVRPICRTLGCFILLAALAHIAAAASAPAEAGDAPAIPGGELQIIGPEGKPVGACPLKHTEVTADISGFVARTTVRQIFHNPLEEKIEAIYTFPLPQDSAVDEMIMTVGDRRVVGQVKPRDEARDIYEAARARGHVASLLDQERPNIFTQSVANIEPGAEVVIEIGYVETLKYEDGWYEFTFPMVVGPRYMPGVPSGGQGHGWQPDTDQVPDASRISPPITPEGTRAGHDISLSVNIDAGMPVQEIQSVLHHIDEARPENSHVVKVALRNEKEIPNRDFILRYRTAGDEITDGMLIHEDERGRFFTLLLQPPVRVLPEQARAKEMIFVIDKSGSMSGFPIEKAKQTMSMAIEGMNPNDTFNLIIFDGGRGQLFERSQPNTPQNRKSAQEFLATLQGSGGTEMMPAVLQALEGQDPKRVRIVCFMTDGYVGNDMAIIDAVKKNAGTARVFSFGIGQAVNRYLLDGMAHAGRGEVEYVTLQSQSDAAVKRFHERIHSPVLTDISIDFGDLAVEEVYPQAIPDLFSSKPIMVHGRLKGDRPAAGAITLRGKTAEGDHERRIDIAPPEGEMQAEHAALPSLWARAKVADLMMRDLTGLQHGSFPEDLKRQITDIGMQFALMTQFTSFVAVEEMTITVGGEPRTIAVPVEMPDGVSYEGIFGDRRGGMPVASRRASGVGGHVALYSRMDRIESAARPATGEPMRQLAEERQRIRNLTEDADLGLAYMEPSSDPQDKLAPALTDLADRVEQDGRDGNLTDGELRVVDYRVDVMISLADLSPQTLQALEELGFEESGRSHTTRLLIGAIDVRKLKELSELPSVVRIRPVAG